MAATAERHLQGEARMLRFGAQLGRCLNGGLVMYLEGDLGAGKTTLARGILNGLGYDGAVKSPTYTLVEPYYLQSCTVFHFDLYRLGDPEELEYLGVRDYFSPDSVALIEWPERGEGVLPPADVRITIAYENSGRRLTLQGQSPRGDQLLAKLA